MKFLKLSLWILLFSYSNLTIADFGDGNNGGGCQCGTGCGGGDFGGILCPSPPPTDEECLGNSRVYAYSVFRDYSSYDWISVIDAWEQGDPEVVSFSYSPSITNGDNLIRLKLTARDMNSGFIEVFQFNVTLERMPSRSHPDFMYRCHRASIVKI